MKSKKDCDHNGKHLGQLCSESKPQHTPTPWKSEGHDIVSVNPDRHIAAIIRHNPGTTVDEQIANTSFIVRAVNCHEFLIKTLEEIGLQLERGSSTMAIQKTVREAIAKAEKGS